MFIYSSRISSLQRMNLVMTRKEDLKSCVVTIADILEEIHPPSVHWTDEESLSQSSEFSDTLSVISVGQEEVVAPVQAKAEG